MLVLWVTCEQANLSDKVVSGSTSVSCCCVLFLSSPVETADDPSQRYCRPPPHPPHPLHHCWVSGQLPPPFLGNKLKRDAELMRLLQSPWAIVWLQLHTNCERLRAHPTCTPSLQPLPLFSILHILSALIIMSLGSTAQVSAIGTPVAMVIHQRETKHT